MAVNSFFSYLHDFVNPGSNNKVVIDRRTIEKTWKSMDKVSKDFYEFASSAS
jgi:hypothetical protein